MPRKISSIAPDWWDYTTLEDDILRDAANLDEKDLQQLSRSGFQVVFFDTLEEFYLAETKKNPEICPDTQFYCSHSSAIFPPIFFWEKSR